jgi:uncharacterized protein YecA (UPF0149 family)
MKVMNALKKVILGSPETPIPNLGRNERCWCGSGRKYKTCHLDQDDRRRAAARAAAQSQKAGAPLRGL